MSDIENASGWAPRPVYHPTPLQCPSCSGLIERYSEHSQLMVCAFCNERLELTHAEILALGKAEKTEFDQFTLDLGSTFCWEDAEYTVIGRISFLDEDQDPGPKDYLLFHPQFGTLWATEYWGYGFYVTKRTRMLPPKGTLIGTITMADDSKWSFSEKETYVIEQVDGALPWIACAGDQVEIAEYTRVGSSSLSLSIERSSGLDELECSISQKITLKQWKMATGQYTEADAEREARRKMPFWMRSAGLLASVVSAALLGNAAVSLPQAELVADFKYDMSSLLTEQVTETFYLEDVSEPIGIYFSSAIDNEWIGVQYAVLQSTYEDEARTYEELLTAESEMDYTKQTKNILVSDVSFAYYHGSEGGESWSEGSTGVKERWMFTPDKAGTLRLLLTAAYGVGDSETPVEDVEHLKDYSLVVAVFRDDQTSYYYWVAAFFSLVMAAFFWGKSE